MADHFVDDIEKFEAKETAHTLPVGWVILFWALILWGVYYFYMYTPSLGGWSQNSALEESLQK
ncbi:MAG: hypothetical protein M0042_04595 [Nitrospiraceae bacterium]|nr:hypothetical protein [Nitrospiraceae bacterium]